MSRALRSFALVLAASAESALGCVTVQDLGSHAEAAEAGAPDVGPFPFLDGAFPFPGDSGPPGKIFFVTKGRYSGDLATEGGAASGPAGGDSLCTREAGAAGHVGLFRAWLSTSKENAKSRIKAVGPWRSLGSVLLPFPGAAVADPPGDFLHYTADGTDLFFEPQRLVWTGTKLNGTLNDNGDTCADWTSSPANVRGGRGDFNEIGDGRWTDSRALDRSSETSPCSERLRLYCFEQ